MILSDVSIRRPVFATVISLLLIVLGIFAFSKLPLRELPDIDPPVVSVSTSYPGASAAVVETRITQLIEDAVSGIEGVDLLTSSSRNGALERQYRILGQPRHRKRRQRRARRGQPRRRPTCPRTSIRRRSPRSTPIPK